MLAGNEPIQSLDELLQVVVQLRRQVRTALAAAERAAVDADRLYEAIKRVRHPGGNHEQSERTQAR